MKKTKQPNSLVAPFIVLIILAAALTLVFWVCFQVRNHVPPKRVNHPTASDPRADLRTYSNNEYGFSLEYPASWHLTSVTQKTPYPAEKIGITFTTGWCEPICYLGIGIELQHATLNDYIKEFGTEKNASIIVKREPTTFNGLPATKITTETGMGDKPTYIVIERPIGLVIISADESDNTQQQILSTFKFADDMSDWKTYSDKDNGFSFRYPPDMSPQPPRNGSVSFFSADYAKSIVVTVLEKAYDPNYITRPDNAGNEVVIPKSELELVKVGTQDGFRYRSGFLSCSSTIIVTDLKQNRTLKISFGRCEDGSNSLENNTVAQDQILSTFRFTK